MWVKLSLYKFKAAGFISRASRVKQDLSTAGVWPGGGKSKICCMTVCGHLTNTPIYSPFAAVISSALLEKLYTRV